MLRPALLLTAIASTLLIAGTKQAEPLREHASRLRSNQGLTLTLSATEIGGSAVEHKLVLGQPNSIKWETDSTLIVIDGKSKWTLDKKSNSFTEEAADAATAQVTMSNFPLWLWAAMFDKEWEKAIQESKPGRERKLGGVPVQEYQIVVKLANASKTLTVMLSIEDKTVKGAIIPSSLPGGADTIVIVNESQWMESIPAGAFVFTAPDGAKKVEPGAIKVVPIADALAIFRRECINCHGPNLQQSRVRLDSYQAIMSSNVVVAGNPDASRVIRALKGAGAPQMPPGKKLSESDINIVAGWIKGGAKNE